LIGDSDEDEDFHGFTEKEIQFANLKSEYLQSQTDRHTEAFWAAKGVALDPADREEILKNSGVSTASDQEDDSFAKISTPEQLRIPPTEPSIVTKDKAGGEKIKSIEKSKLLVQNLLSDGLCKPKTETTSESSSQKKRKVLKKRVKVAIPKISDFKKFLELKLNKDKSGGLENKTECESESVTCVESILEKVEESQPTKLQTRKKKPIIKSSQNNKLNSAKPEELPDVRSTDTEEVKTSLIFESDKQQVNSTTTESLKDEVIDSEAKVPLLHQNLIVEGKRRWKPSFKIQDKIESPQNRNKRSLSLDTASLTSQNSESETTVKPETPTQRNDDSQKDKIESETLETNGLQKSVKHYANAMSEGKENKDSGDLKQIQRILQSQWKGRLKKPEERKRSLTETPTSNVQTEPKKFS